MISSQKTHFQQKMGEVPDRIRKISALMILYLFSILRVLWSKPIPLGWYFAPQWQRQFDSPKWQEYLCDDWIKNDRYLKNFASDVSDFYHD